MLPYKLFRAFLSRIWPGWKRKILVVQPKTVVSWHRAGFKLYWKWISRSRMNVGRRPTSKELREPIFRMVEENPCRWHDLRHSAASKIAVSGATDQTLQASLGWMSPKMIEKHSHVRAEARRRAVSVFDMVDSDLESPKNPPQSAVVENQKIM
jgi:hypothetical protein